MMSKHIRVEIGFGLEMDKAQKRIKNSGTKLIFIQRQALDLFGFYTYFPTVGAWTSPGGIVTEERGGCIVLQLEDFPTRRHLVEALARYIKEKLNQEAVALSITPTDFELV